MPFMATLVHLFLTYPFGSPLLLATLERGSSSPCGLLVHWFTGPLASHWLLIGSVPHGGAVEVAHAQDLIDVDAVCGDRNIMIVRRRSSNLRAPIKV